MMFEVSLAGCCGNLLSLALEEAMGGKEVAVIGPDAKKMRFLGWKPDIIEDPMLFSPLKRYDTIVCIQCLPMLNGVRLVNVNNKIYGAKGYKLISLTREQLREAKAFMKKAGIKLPRGESTLLPLELSGFLDRIRAALTNGGKALFIGYGDPGVFTKLSSIKQRVMPFSRLIATTKAGKMHVVNFNPYLSNSPHLIRDSPVLALAKRLKCENKVVPWLDIRDKLEDGDRILLEPFIVPFFRIFSGWGDIVRDYRVAANELLRQLNDIDGVAEVYASSFAVGNPLPDDFSEKALLRASEIAYTPDTMPLFAVILQKVYK